ncbi:hypothetical protein V2J09_015928 [Rumex salicifolius]
MRIRKRALPLPFSLLSPVPPPAFSDPHLHLPVQLSQPSDLPSPPSQVEDHRPAAPTPLRSDGQLVIQAFEDGKTNQEQRDNNSRDKHKVVWRGERTDASQKKLLYNENSKQRDPGAVADDNGVKLQIPLPLSNQTTVTATEGRWCDGDKAIPLKKRKASLEMNGVVGVTGEYRKMKSMTNKKCPLSTKSTEEEDDDDDYEEDNNNSDSDTKKTKKTSKKKKKKGGSRVIMEGSRCSRVNGRGWRCMQPTLVGYSLCEHHLGKGGRLRSINSATVRARSLKLDKSVQHGDGDDDGDGDGDVEEEEEEERKPISTVAGNGRKRMRVGMVKARSLSSLLCQPNTVLRSSN